METSRTALVPQETAPIVLSPPTQGVILASEVMSREEQIAEAVYLAEEAKKTAEWAVASSTRINYQRAWNRFEHWCWRRSYSTLPAAVAVVHEYLQAAMSVGIHHSPGATGMSQPGKRLSRSSVILHISAIKHFHEAAGLDTPTALLPKDFLHGLRKRLAAAPKKKTWLSQEDLYRAVDDIPVWTREGQPRLQGLRDRAILLIGFTSGGRRRSEITGMRVEDLRREGQGWLWTIGRRKTDQEGRKPLVLPIYYFPDEPGICPARALEAWLKAAGITGGPVFRAVTKDNCGHDTRGGQGIQPRVVANIVKDAVAKMGKDPKDYAGHSLRSGFITQKLRQGLRLEAIMKLTGQVSMDTARGYEQAAKLMSDQDEFMETFHRGTK